MAKRESVATLKKQLAATEKKLTATKRMYNTPTTTLLFEECAPIMYMKSKKPYPSLCEELSLTKGFKEMVECADPDTIGYIIADAVRVGMEMGKRLHEAKRLEEMVGYGEGQ